MTILTVFHSSRDIIPNSDNNNLHNLLGRGHVLQILTNKQTLTQIVTQEDNTQASITNETSTPRFLIAWEGRRNRAPTLHEANEIEWEHTGLEYEAMFKATNLSDETEDEERHVLFRMDGSNELITSVNVYNDEEDFFDNFSEPYEGDPVFVSMLDSDFESEEETEVEDGTGGTDSAIETTKVSNAIEQHHSAVSPTV